MIPRLETVVKGQLLHMAAVRRSSRFVWEQSFNQMQLETYWPKPPQTLFKIIIFICPLHVGPNKKQTMFGHFIYTT